MKRLILFLFTFGTFFCAHSLSQSLDDSGFEVYVHLLPISTQDSFVIVAGVYSFEKDFATDGDVDLECFFLSESGIDIAYYPKQKGVKCGYFEINEFCFLVDGKFIFKNGYHAGCDLDYGSFKVFEMNFKAKKYLLITSINNGSGTSTRYVYCHLFDVSDLDSITYFPLWSIYGSYACFGDFNQDGFLDFLRIRNESNMGDGYFRATLSTLYRDSFRIDSSHYIIFNRRYDSHWNPVLTVVDNKMEF